LKARTLNERITKLRSESRKAIPYVSLERALLITEFYKTGAAHKFSLPVARAKAFKYIIENKKICINEGELIVGETKSKRFNNSILEWKINSR